MFIKARFKVVVFFLSLLCAAGASAQEGKGPSESASGEIHLDVVVTPKSGAPVAGLQQQDFTLLDNKVPQTVTSFQSFGGSRAPIEVLLVVDAVNTDYQNLGYERDEIEKFLRLDGGHLAHPTALAVFTDTGTQIQEEFTSDGNALSGMLEMYTVGLRTIHGSSGIYGAEERFQLSIAAVEKLVAREAGRPGRKIILWVSPGWPFLSGPRVELDSKQQRQLFTTIVSLSTQLRRASITLYSIDPLGIADIGSRTFYYEEFLKGVSKPSQVQAGDLALEVLATQSGGLVLKSGNDVVAQLQKCLADTEEYYEISFVPTPADQRDTYHKLEVRVVKPGLTARTRQGYYTQTSPHE
jgi:VWFA-related protein